MRVVAIPKRLITSFALLSYMYAQAQLSEIPSFVVFCVLSACMTSSSQFPSHPSTFPQTVIRPCYRCNSYLMLYMYGAGSIWCIVFSVDLYIIV